MSNEKAPEKKKAAATRMTLNASDKQYIAEGLKTVRAQLDGVEKTMFFDPQKVGERLDELIAFYSK